MITELTAKVRLAKHIDDEGNTHQSQPFKSFTSKELDIQTAKDFDQYLNNLGEQQTIIYGLLDNPTGPRSLANIKGIRDPWIAFDGDYIINNLDLRDNKGVPIGPVVLNLELLISLDPQLANCMHVFRHSSSNLIIDGKHKNKHKKKIWFKFKSQDQEEIANYITVLFTRAITMNYGEYFISESDKSFQTYVRTIFDKVVFSPERIWNEAPPKIEAGNIEHNSYSYHTEGHLVDPTAIHHLTDQEISVYQQIMANLKHNIQPKVQARKELIKRNHPKLYSQMVSAEAHVLSTSVITHDNIDIPVIDLINDYITTGTTHSDLSFRDPLDREYGTDKAKLYYNDDGSIKLHSFAHGSQTYHLLIPIKDFYKFSITEGIQEGRKLSRKDRFAGMDIVKALIPYVYINDMADLEIIIEELKHLSTKPTVKKLFELAATSKSVSLSDNDLMDRYSLFRRKDAPWVSFDSNEGLIFISREGMNAIMDNKVVGLTGSEVSKQYLSSADRKEVDGFGMYISSPTGKLNLWAGFNAHNLAYPISEADIQPYLDLVDLIAAPGEERKAFLDWRADLVQQPLRKGGRPGYAVKGDKGTGKSFEQDLIADMFHPFNVMRIHSMDQLIGKHNAEIVHTVLIIAEEMHMGNTSYAGSRDTLKALLFSPTYRIEPKGIDSMMVPNHIHLMLSTNHAEAVIQDSDDRRWTIFEINARRMRDKAFFGGIHKWWNSGGKNLVYTYLLQREYKLSDVTEGKLTASGKEERIHGFYGIDAWVYMLLNDMTEDLRNSASNLYNSYCGWFDDIYPNRQAPTLNKFGLELNNQGIIKKFSNDRILRKNEGRLAFEKKFFEGKKHTWKDATNEPDDGLPNIEL